MKKNKSLIGNSGIYALVVEENNTEVIRYVGSASDLESRKSNHLSNLRKKKHKNEYLQSLFNEVGEGKFKFMVLERCNKSLLLEREKYYKQLHEDTILNIRDILNTKKKVRRGRESSNLKHMFSELMSGENNPNCRLSETEAGEILWLKQNTEMRLKEIAEKYNISPSQVGNIGVRRWIDVKAIPVELETG